MDCLGSSNLYRQMDVQNCSYVGIWVVAGVSVASPHSEASQNTIKIMQTIKFPVFCFYIHLDSWKKKQWMFSLFGSILFLMWKSKQPFCHSLPLHLTEVSRSTVNESHCDGFVCMKLLICLRDTQPLYLWLWRWVDICVYESWTAADHFFMSAPHLPPSTYTQHWTLSALSSV